LRTTDRTEEDCPPYGQAPDADTNRLEAQSSTRLSVNRRSSSRQPVAGSHRLSRRQRAKEFPNA
jgi:hypothetical protein